MKIDDKVKQLIDKVMSGKMDEHLHSLDRSDFGLYIPVYLDGETIKLMADGYSQTETNLKITVTKVSGARLEDSLVVGWMGGEEDNGGTQCRGSHNSCLGHCKGQHNGPIKNCKNHPRRRGSRLVAPQLDYDSAMEELKTKQSILNSIAKEGFGLALLHGHNDEFPFTKLPEGIIAVIANDETSFREETEVKNDSTFVPNTWRSINGEFLIAGGHSLT